MSDFLMYYDQQPGEKPESVAEKGLPEETALAREHQLFYANLLIWVHRVLTPLSSLARVLF